jgi:hypothetical protein
MPKGTARPGGSVGEVVNHFNAIRMRVVGHGNLKMTMYSLQDIRYQQLSDLPMSLATNIQPTRLSNFIEQRASLRIGTQSINDYFRINRIIIYTKTIASEYPA